MKNIGLRIKTKRKLSGLTQEKLAQKIGTTKAAVSRWETGRNAVAPDKLSTLASIFEVDVEWLLTGELFATQKEIDEAVFWVPLYNKVKVSAGDGVINAGIGHELIPMPIRFIKYQNNKGHIFCVNVKGDSMIPVLYDGAIIAVNSMNTTIRDGRMYLVLQDDLLRVKVVHQLPDRIILRSYNSDFKDEEYKLKESRVHVIGEVFWFTSLAN
jgi:phage repressor protein C with HTH and peptisase S24 domain